MAKVRVAFELYEDSLQKLVGYKNLNIHMVFDIHMGNILEKKAGLVADGHLTHVLTVDTYSTVVSRDSVHFLQP